MLFLPLILLQASGPAPDAPPCAACVAWEVTTAQAEALLATTEPLDGVEVLLRPAMDGADPEMLLRGLAARGARTGLIVSDVRATPRGASVAGRILIDLRDRTDDLDRLAFEVKRLATEIRAGNPKAEIGIETGPGMLEPIDKRGVGAYLDYLVGAPTLNGPQRRGGLPVWIRKTPLRSVEGYLDGAPRVLLAPDDGVRTILAMRALAEVLPEGLTPLDAVTVSCPEDQGGCESRVFLHPRTLDAIAIVTPRGPVRQVAVNPGAKTIHLVPLSDPAAPGGSVLTKRPGASGVFDVPSGPGPFVLRIAGWSGGGKDRFAADVEVVGERTLTVEEIVARHQAAAARQRRDVGRSISSGSLVATFEAPGLAAPMTLTSDVVVYEDGGQREIEQRSLRLNGVEYAGDATGVPRLPLLEPERVTSPPLAITLDDAYRYRLEGRETALGQDCYVLGFEPRSPARPLFRGRAWIAARGFAMVRTETVQTGLRGPIVSSRQRDDFTPVPVGDGVAWLPSRSEIHQVYEGPGHRTPIDRVLALTRLEANPEDFAARRAAAHASPSVMVADTPSGLRYLRRAADAAATAGAEPRRETAGTGGRVRTMALGVLVDPNIGRPLPFAGVSYVDFDFLRTGAQVNGFFGGVFGQIAWTVPSLGGSRWQAHGSGFAVLASYNDRAFRGGVERYEENLKQRPARLALGVARPLWGQARLRLGYELDYTRLGRADTTAAEFVVPVSPVVHGIRVGLEAQRGPWSAEAWWNGAVRQRWAAWGWSASEPAGTAFQRFGASAARSFVLSPRAVARVEAAWMGGRGLDRFSRYGFDGFRNTLRGYPTATVRYDRGGIARGALAWNAARKVRLDAFLDAARARDPGIGPQSRTYVGVGAGLEAPLPLRALASVEWGYGFQARGRAGETGTHVVRVTAYKIF